MLRFMLSTSEHDESISKKISANTIIYIKSDCTETDMTDKIIKGFMCEKQINSAIYMTTDTLILCDPRAYIIKNKLLNDTHVYMNNEIIMRVLYSNSDKFSKHYVDKINISDCQNTQEIFKIGTDSFNWIPKQDGNMNLYKIYDNNSQKIDFACNDIKVNPEIFLMYVEHTTPIVELLRKVKVAIILMGLEEKYKTVMRSAPLTLMFDTKNTKQTYDSNLEKSPIFVYPEALKYFFSFIYPMFKTSFVLYLTYDSMTREEIQKLDTKHIIKDVIYGGKTKDKIK